MFFAPKALRAWRELMWFIIHLLIQQRHLIYPANLMGQSMTYLDQKSNGISIA